MAWEKAINTDQVLVVDVRSRGEFASGHVSGAVNIPLDELPAAVESLRQKSEMLVFCCMSGNRSGQATRFLAAQGLKNVYNGGSWFDVNYIKNNA